MEKSTGIDPLEQLRLERIASVYSRKDTQNDHDEQCNVCSEEPNQGKIEKLESSESKTNGMREPDWSKFETVFAKDLLPVVTDVTVNGCVVKGSQDKSGESKSASDLTDAFLLELVGMLLGYVHKSNDRGCKVLDFHHPHLLREMMGHCIDIPDTPQDLEQILSDCKETLKYCVKTGHPRFFNQLSSGLDTIALAGEWLTATANTNMFTYEVAPVFTLMEDVVLAKMREHIGWDPASGDGIFAPGGAISNLYAVTAARHKAFPSIKTKGLLDLPALAMFTSDQSHFSIKGAAALLGIGTDNVILVQSDSRGKMLVKDLREKLMHAKSDGLVPFFVSATAGTTVLGAFDPFSEIADVCEEFGVWFHVDGAWGGSLILSKKYKHLLHGIERADSKTWTPHKLMGATLQCSAILMKQKGLLEDCNSLKADYLFQSDKQYDVSYDTGDKAIQCGRHNDIFKLWLMWRAKGDIGFENQINRLMDLSLYLQKELKKREGFELLLVNTEFLNVCFWYIPCNMRHLPKGPQRDALLHKVAPGIKAMMMEKGTTMVGYQPLGNRPNFFRMILSNPASTPADIDFLLDEIVKLGEEL